MKLIQMSLIAMILVVSACSKDDKAAELDCSLVFCTLDFRSITVDLVNSDGEALTQGSPYFLERTLEGSDKIIEVTNSMEDRFVILDDSHLSILNPEGTNIIVKVFRVGVASNDLINISKYVIGRDCCHISKVSGPDNIKVEN